MQRSFWTVMLW